MTKLGSVLCGVLCLIANAYAGQQTGWAILYWPYVYFPENQTLIEHNGPRPLSSDGVPNSAQPQAPESLDSGWVYCATNATYSTTSRMWLDYPIVSIADVQEEQPSTSSLDKLSTQPPRVVLLLHGMAADPSTWDEFRRSRGGTCTPIIGGEILFPLNQLSDRDGINNYCVDFGYYDKQSLAAGIKSETGTDGKPLTARNDPKRNRANGDCNGDYESFTALGDEVGLAVKAVLRQHKGASIVLVAHSRGGLAARAFLQDSEHKWTSERSAIVAMLTLGTPNGGSPIGRIFKYLERYPRPGAYQSGISQQEWELADQVRGSKKIPVTLFGFWHTEKKRFTMDVRRPTVDYLSDGSLALKLLNNGIAGLPPSVSYGSVLFSGADIGCLSDQESVGVGYVTLWEATPDTLADATAACRTDILGTGKTEFSPEFDGDGIVPLKSQRLDSVAGFKGSYKTKTYALGRDCLHTDETANTDAIMAGLKMLVDWYK